MQTDYDRIRQENIREYGEGTRHLSFLGRLYTDRTHFIFELLQNAEDAEATIVTFTLYDDRLEMLHNGRPFNEDDVRGVCGVGEGKKAESLTKIGKFGIGFKSVYAFTSSPEIHSGEESFKVENYIRPFRVDGKVIAEGWTTLFIFPFDSGETTPDVSYNEIKRCLCDLSIRTLMFLRKISFIKYNVSDSIEGIYHRKEDDLYYARLVEVSGKNNIEFKSEKWIVFERLIPVPDSSENVRVEVSFQLGKSEPEQIVKVDNSPLVVFFPTEKMTRLGFLINGPYRTTPARDNIPIDDRWNSYLIKETAELVVESLEKIKKLGLLTVSFLRVLPVRTEDFPVDSMFYPIFDSVRRVLLEEKLLPTNNGEFVSAADARLGRSAGLRELLDQDQLCLLFQSINKPGWLSGEITNDRTPELRIYLIKELGIEEVTPEMFAKLLNYKFLSAQQDDWFIDLYKYLSGQEALWRKPRWKHDPSGILRSKPILRLEDNSQQIPFHADTNIPNAYLPPPEKTDFMIVKRSIANDGQAKDFLIRLGLSEPDRFDIIVKNILPKYFEPNHSVISEQEHYEDIEAVLTALKSNDAEGKSKVINLAKRTPFLKAVNLSGETVFKKAEEIYHNTRQLKTFFQISKSVWFLYDKYSLSSAYIDALSELGVSELPRRVPVDDDFSNVKREYSTREDSVDNYDLEGLEQFLELICKTSSFEEKKELSKILWEFLNRHLYQNHQFFEAVYYWFYRKAHRKNFKSLIFNRLGKAAWLPTKSQTFEKPGEVTTDQIPEEFLDADELVKSLGISEVKGEDDLKREHAKELGVSLDDIEFLKNNHEEIKKLKASLAARKERPTFPTRSVADPERREERLGEQLTDAPNKEYEKRERSVRITNRAIDPITWLRNQYTNEADQMVCQICKEEMPFRKRNGEYYFEKKEVLSRKYLLKEHEAQYLALCPLCAAMYEEFIKSDDDSMADLKGRLISTEGCDIPIKLGSQEMSIRFVETHRHDLKVIIDEAE